MNELPLTPQQLMAVQYLCLGLPKSLVAEEVGIARKTLYTWERLPEFQREMQRLLSEADSATRMKLRSLASVAVETLQQCMMADEVPWPVRFNAAVKVLSLVMQDKDLDEGMIITPSEKRTIPFETLKRIRTEVYGIHDGDESPTQVRRRVLGVQDDSKRA